MIDYFQYKNPLITNCSRLRNHEVLIFATPCPSSLHSPQRFSPLVPIILSLVKMFEIREWDRSRPPCLVIYAFLLPAFREVFMRTSFNLISSVVVQTANTIRGLFFVLTAVFFGVYPVVLTLLERLRITSESGLRQTTNADLYHVTKFPL